MENFQQKDVENGVSIPEPTRVEDVPTSRSSPFDTVKLELALVLIAGVMVAIGGLVATGLGLMFTLLLAGYTSIAAIWLIWRTRRILARTTASSSRSSSRLDGCG